MEKRLILRSLILFFLILFCMYSIFLSSSGLKSYFREKGEIEIKKKKIYKLENKIKELQKSIKRLQEKEFELEKLARQDLLMGSPGETVYLEF
ncbi:hypothetical protein GF385_03930 [Candidatus Dependentiae bacterium]|nr:hypothetical protein [Candidatus Dependentiae bacterium]